MRALIFLIAAAAYGQTFEVASIKPGGQPVNGMLLVGMKGGPGTPDPGMFTASNIGLDALVSAAFGISNYQLSAPEWMASTRFTITAKVPEGTTKAQFLTMQQNLLIERFKMAFHREKKEMQVYDLLVAKGGSKLKEYVKPSETPQVAPRPSGGPQVDEDGYPVMPPGREGMRAMANGHTTLVQVNESMVQFAKFLATRLHHPVNDATGLTATYNLTLRFVSDSMRSQGDDDPGATLFQALPQQLGLKLESRKGTVDIFVIDHMEKTPTEN